MLGGAMKTDEFAVKCGNCDQEYNDEFFLNLCKKIHFAFIPDNGFYKLNFSCSNCQNQIYAKFQGEAVRRINDAINGTMVDIEVELYDPDEPYEPDFDDAWLDSLEDELPESCEASSFQEHLDDLVVPLPQFVEENTHESANGSEKPDTVKVEEGSKSNIELFKYEIKGIDKNLDEFDQSEKIRELLPLLVDGLDSEIEACWNSILLPLPLSRKPAICKSKSLAQPGERSAGKLFRKVQRQPSKSSLHRAIHRH
jgi:hypothetical protein